MMTAAAAARDFRVSRTNVRLVIERRQYVCAEFHPQLGALFCKAEPGDDRDEALEVSVSFDVDDSRGEPQAALATAAHPGKRQVTHRLVPVTPRCCPSPLSP